MVLDSWSFFKESDAELEAIVEELNELFVNDRHVSPRLPLKPETLIEECVDGIIICKFINIAKPGTIDSYKLHEEIDRNYLLSKKREAGNKALFEATANANMAITGATKIGVKMINYGPGDIVNANRKIVLGLLWQIMRIYLLGNIGVNGHPELVHLLESNESLQHLCEEGPEAILIRWFNYHLRRSGTTRRIKDFGEDLQDGECLLRVMMQIGRHKHDQATMEQLRTALNSNDNQQRYHAIMKAAQSLGCIKYIRRDNLVNKRKELNMVYTALLFNNHIGIRLPTEDDIDEMEALIDILKRRLQETGKKLDEDDVAISDAYRSCHAMVGKLTDQLEAMQAQAEQDGDAIKLYEQLLRESQRLVEDLQKEVEEQVAINDAVIAFHNRQVDKIHSLQDSNGLLQKLDPNELQLIKNRASAAAKAKQLQEQQQLQQEKEKQQPSPTRPALPTPASADRDDDDDEDDDSDDDLEDDFHLRTSSQSLNSPKMKAIRGLPPNFTGLPQQQSDDDEGSSDESDSHESTSSLSGVPSSASLPSPADVEHKKLAEVEKTLRNVLEHLSVGQEALPGPASLPLPDLLKQLATKAAVTVEELVTVKTNLEKRHDKLMQLNDVMSRKAQEIAESYAKKRAACALCGQACKRCPTGKAGKEATASSGRTSSAGSARKEKAAK